VKLAGAENFIIQAYPVAIQAGDVGMVLLTSLLLCLSASAWPASVAAAVQPADAVRSE
jgi:lipoprotein-releasing system permease protein